VAVVRTFLNTAERAGWIERSPAAHIKLETPRSRRRHSTLDLDESRRLIAAGRSERDRALLTLLLTTGARVGELCAARVRDWDGTQLRLEGKTGERCIPVGGPAAEVLNAAVSGESSDTPLLTGRQGGLSVRQAQIVFAEACERAGLARRGPHQARHAAAVRWVVSGVPIFVVSELLGHARVSTTTDFYLHASPPMLARAMADDPLLKGAA
jgi:integrase